MLAYVGPIMAHVGPVLALCWPYVGPMLAYVGPMLAHLGAYVGAMLAISEAIYVERPPRCEFFRPGPLRRTKKNRDAFQLQNPPIGPLKTLNPP